VQPKLTIGEPNDKYEQEADRVAGKVVQRINSGQGETQNSIKEDSDVQRSVAPVMRKPQRNGGIVSGRANDEFESQLHQSRGGGSPLESKLRGKLESAMGADFSQVKIHTGSQSDQLNRSIQAKAFTTGNDVFFKQGEYNPSSRSGQELIAHELTHVVQQGGSQMTAQRKSDAVIQRFGLAGASRQLVNTLPGSNQLSQVLTNPLGLGVLRDYAITEFSVENVDFYIDYQKCSTNSQSLDYLYSTYIPPGSDNEINISGSNRKAIQKAQENGTLSLDTFKAALSDVLSNMGDTYGRLVLKSDWAEELRDALFGDPGDDFEMQENTLNN
ncbi:MAG: DUF4157 domain-containing protein, partial [Cyanobacteria bacterium J06642_11]